MMCHNKQHFVNLQEILIHIDHTLLETKALSGRTGAGFM